MPFLYVVRLFKSDNCVVYMSQFAFQSSRVYALLLLFLPPLNESFGHVLLFPVGLFANFLLL